MSTLVRRAMLAAVAVVMCTVPSASQTMATRHVMLGKLEKTQHVLEALLKSDCDLLERESQALARVPEQPGWSVLTTAEYVRYSQAFLNTTHDLLASARARALDAAMTHYQALTMTCYQCHRYVKNARIAVWPISSMSPDARYFSSVPPTRKR